MPKYYVSTRSYNLGSHTPGRAQGGTLEEPTAGNLHGGVREGRELPAPRLTYTRTKLETADRAKEDLLFKRFSSTRNRDVSSVSVHLMQRLCSAAAIARPRRRTRESRPAHSPSPTDRNPSATAPQTHP